MTNKQVQSCFLNRSSSNHFCCTDSLLMTHLADLVWVSLFGELEERGGGGGASFLLPWGRNILLAALNRSIIHKDKI